MKYTSILLVLLGAIGLSGQDYRFYADVMVNASEAQHRQLAAERFESLFLEALNAEDSFKQSFEDLSWIAIQYPEDRSFRIISWQIDEGNGRYSYKGYFQNSDSSLLPFARDGAISSTQVDRSIPWPQWQGGIIYKILTIPTSDGNDYYALTFNQIDAYTKQKSLEPIHLEDEVIVLGHQEIFEIQGRSQRAKRLTITYSADSNAAITYQSAARQLVVDHLVSIPGRIPGQGPTMAPDGSYVSYRMQDDGSWEYQEKLFDQKFVNPPSGGISSGGKDIFGRPKN